HYQLPTVQREIDDSDAQTLSKMANDQLSIKIIEATIKSIGIFESPASSKDLGIIERKKCYEAKFTGELTPSAGIHELVWLTFQDRQMVAKKDRNILDFLNEKGVLNK
ncbi:MAG: NUDIX hydrolase, partial [Leeuwenhoekiella sp.]